MDAFQRCVQDLGSIDRLLQLPHGRDIAVEMFRELSPYLDQLTGLREQDPTGALACLFDYADGARASGPPERGLFEYRYRITDGELWILPAEMPTPGVLAENHAQPAAAGALAFNDGKRRLPCV